MTTISFVPLVQFVVIVLMILGIVLLMRWKGIFKETDQPVFDKLVTELAAPAVIFSIFVTSDFSPDTLFPALILAVTLAVALIVAFAICHARGLPPKMTGTLVMISGFASTATLVSPLLVPFFSAQPAVLEKGITIATLGVAFPFFTVGVLIASYYGAKAEGKDVSFAGTLKQYLGTPIFISFVLGVIVAVLLLRFRIPGADSFLDIFTHFFGILSLSMNLLIWIAIGLMLRPVKLRMFLPLFLLVIGIKLVLSPVVAGGLGIATGQSLINQQILLLESAAPSGAIAAVMASRYGCDNSLAGWMVVGTYLVSLATIPLVFLLFTA